MKSKYSFIALTFLLLIFSASCDRPECKNTNPVFDNNSPDSKVYKSELANQLDQIDKEKLKFWFYAFKESGEGDELWFNVQGDGLCAVIPLKVTDWNKLELLRSKKGVSFRGAKFKNLKFGVVRNDSEISFVLKSFDKIID